MARRAKPKVQELKSAKVVETAPKVPHEVYIVQKGTDFPYLDATCRTCNRQALVGGPNAEKMLRSWAESHRKGSIVTLVKDGDGGDGNAARL